MQILEVSLSPELIKLLSAEQTARVISICRAHRVPCPAALPPAAFGIIQGIMIDAEEARERRAAPRGAVKVRRKVIKCPKVKL